MVEFFFNWKTKMHKKSKKKKEVETKMIFQTFRKIGALIPIPYKMYFPYRSAYLLIAYAFHELSVP